MIIGLGDVRVEPHHKGFPAWAVGRSVNDLHELRLANGTFGTPVLLLHQEALDGNIRAMQQFCTEAGFSLSPHVKTTMSPEIVSRQLEQGAWAVTVATPTQARTAHRLGMRRILLANELVEPSAITWLGKELDRDAEFAAYCYVDSSDGIDVLVTSLAATGQHRPLPVIVELGVRGGRTGTRNVEDAVRLAGMVMEAPLLRLAGVGGFEGIIDVGMSPERLDEVAEYLEGLRRLADETLAMAAQDEEFIVTVGGSAFVELVRNVFDAEWSVGRPVRAVLRSGCYVTHDSGAYRDYRSMMQHLRDPLQLNPALELWGRVVSRPEPRLAIADFGKRDVGMDAGPPLLQHTLRRSRTTVEPAPRADVVAMNDQHAYLRAAPTVATLDLDVGDLVGFGISHPCTTFDKWRLIPMVDGDRRMVGAARTLF